MGRRIVWDLHAQYPVLVLKKYDSATVNRLKQFYDTVKTGILVLADENSISQNDFEKFEHDIEKIDRPIVALCVKRGDPRKANHHMLPLDIIGGDSIDAIIQKCSAIALRKNKMHIIEERKSSMFKVLTGNMLCPLLISLYLLEEEFESLDMYVLGFLKKLNGDSDSVKIKRALRYVALCNYFSTKLLPSALVKMIASGDNNVRMNLDERLRPVDDLLLYTDKKIYLGFRHYLIAEEVMRQLFVPEEVEVNKDTWKDYIKKHGLEFIDYLYGQCYKKIDLDIIDIITALFIDKNQSSLVRDENSDAKFSLIIETIPNVSDERISVLRYLAETFNDFIRNIDAKDGYKEYAMLSRIWANCGRYYSKSNLKNFSEADICCQNALVVMEKIDSNDYDIYHMAGLCVYEKAKAEFSSFENIDELERVKVYIDDALDLFNKTTCNGSPDYGITSFIRLVSEFSRKVFTLYGIDSLKDIIKVKEIWIQQYIADAFQIINMTDGNEFSDKGRVFFIQQRGYLEELCYEKGISDILEAHNNYLDVLMNGHKDTSSISLTRKFIIQTLLRKYEGNILSLSKNAKDSNQVLKLLEDSIALRNKDSLGSYGLWFKLAKCKNKSISEGLLKASQWKDLLNEKGQKDPLPYYYLYVLSLLGYIEGNSSLQDATRYYYDCRNTYGGDKNVSPTKIRDWFANGKGMGMLFDANLVKLENVLNDAIIAVSQGTISEVDPSGREAYGHITINDQPRLNNSEIFSKVFFVPNVGGISGLQINRKVNFKFGFSYERLTAFDKSVKVMDYGSDLKMDAKAQTEKIEILMNEHPSSLVKKTVEFRVDRFFQRGTTKLLLGKLNNRNAALPSWEISNDMLDDEDLKKFEGQTIKVKVIRYNPDKNDYSLSIKRI